MVVNSIYYDILKMLQYILVHNNTGAYILAYTRIYQYKTFEKICITTGFEHDTSCILTTSLTTAL